MRASIAVCLLAVFAGCGAAPMSSYPPGVPATTAATGAATDSAIPLTKIADSGTGTQRKIIYKAMLSLSVEDFGATETAIAALVKKAGGYVAQFREDRPPGSIRGGQWVLRVPVEKFDAVLEGASQLGVPQNRQVESEDITEEHVDLTARLLSKQGIETRLLELVKTKAGDVKDVVAVETELGRVREEIERIEGRLRFLADRVAMTTITIHAYELRSYRPEQATLTGKIASTFWQSMDGMRTLAECALLAAVALAPWIVALLVVVLPLVLVLRRLTRKPAARASAGAVA